MTLFMHNQIFLCACEQLDKGTQPSKIYITYDILVIDSSMQSERKDAVCVCVCVFLYARIVVSKTTFLWRVWKAGWISYLRLQLASILNVGKLVQKMRFWDREGRRGWWRIVLINVKLFWNFRYIKRKKGGKKKPSSTWCSNAYVWATNNFHYCLVG